MRVVLSVAVTLAPEAGDTPSGSAKAQPAQLWKLVMTSLANSWNTLADTNGCSSRLSEVNVVPTRRVARPISLSMSLVEMVPTRANAGDTAGPNISNASTLVRDQMNPAEGSMNQL